MSEPLFIDTHGHVQFHAFKDDAGEVIERTLKGGGWIVIPGSQIDTSKAAVTLAERYEEGVYAAVGLHPLHLEETRVDRSELGGGQEEIRTRHEEFQRSAYEPLLASPKTVAIGEVGLDYWHRPKSKAKRALYMEKQKKAFREQLALADEHKLPVILHCRVAFPDMLAIVKDRRAANRLSCPGVVHSFTGDEATMREFVDLGYFIAFNALIFKLPHLASVVAKTPLARIVLETDSPYLTAPELGEARNEPLNVLITARRIAELLNVPEGEVLERTTENARKLFRI